MYLKRKFKICCDEIPVFSSINNYESSRSNNGIGKDDETSKYYQHRNVLGRGWRENIELEEHIDEMNVLIKGVREATAAQNNDRRNPNANVGDLIQHELQKLIKKKADEKRRLIAARLFDTSKRD